MGNLALNEELNTKNKYTVLLKNIVNGLSIASPTS